MRVVSGLLVSLLTLAPAWADDANSREPKAAPAAKKVPLRVVNILPESQQALLYDRDREDLLRNSHRQFSMDGVALTATGRSRAVPGTAMQAGRRFTTQSAAEAGVYFLNSEKPCFDPGLLQLRICHDPFRGQPVGNRASSRHW